MCNAPPPRPAAGSGQPTTHDARDLMRDGTTARIRLDDQTYTLRITRAGKLILTK
jgi:hemin uptake protein HemP